MFEMSQMGPVGKDEDRGGFGARTRKVPGISVQNSVFLEQEQEFDKN